MRRTLLSTALLATLAASALIAGSVGAMAAKPSGNGPLTGNTASALLGQSTNHGAASQAAQVEILLGLNFITPNGMPNLPRFIIDTVTPGNPYYHKYLTPQEFNADYVQPAPAIAALEQYLESYGLQASQTNAQGYTANDYLYVDGTVGDVEQALSVPVNQFQYKGRSFLANTGDPQLPTSYDGYDLATMVSGVSGLLTFNGIHAMSLNAASYSNAGAQVECQYAGYGDCNGPTGLSPQDTRQIYDAGNLTGRGQTIAIATLAPFLTSDPPAFWSYYGVNRTGTLNEIGVDQTIGAGGASGSGQGGSETSLDVEQSGSMAPGANVEVYVAPNTNNGFIDLFNAVVSGFDGTVPNVSSTSWGEAEQFTTPGYAYLMDQQFEQGAAEGISMFAASGDSGAYDAYGYYGQNGLAVDVPGALTYVTAVGGTTLGATQTQGISGIPTQQQVACMPSTEQAWGWDYLLSCYSDLGFKSEQAAKKSLYPGGSGGGFSILTPEPSWQTGYGGQLLNQTGKGVPDVALNADPFTGYSIYDSSSVQTNAQAPWTDGWGGTSFASPNWAGIAALLNQSTGADLGFLPPQLYGLHGQGMRDITAGDNWYYSAGSGWDAATGLGVPDITSLANALGN